MTDRSVVISIRRADANHETDIIPGTSLVPCSDCGEEIMVSPSGMTQIQLGSEAMCIQCLATKAEEIKSVQVPPGSREELKDLFEEDPSFKDNMSVEVTFPKGDFRTLQPGDRVTRMIAGQIPVDVVVDKIQDGLIYTKGGWTFDALTGVEEDEDLGWGVKFNYTGSYLVKP